jgi:hypothetical protein
MVALALLLAAGCRVSNPPYHGAKVEVINTTNAEATFKWTSPGFFGTPLFASSGAEPVQACSGDYIRAFEPGSYEITVIAGVSQGTFDIAAPSDQMDEVFILIRSDGSIIETDANAIPPSPYCG